MLGTQFESSQPHHAVLRELRFPVSLRSSAIWRGIGGLACGRLVSAEGLTGFQELFRAFVSGLKIPFPGNRDRRGRDLVRMRRLPRRKAEAFHVRPLRRRDTQSFSPSAPQPPDVEPYANELFRFWKLGQARKNNGVLLLVAPNEPIEVGYGLEGTVTDALSSVIIPSERSSLVSKLMWVDVRRLELRSCQSFEPLQVRPARVGG